MEFIPTIINLSIRSVETVVPGEKTQQPKVRGDQRQPSYLLAETSPLVVVRKVMARRQ